MKRALGLAVIFFTLAALIAIGAGYLIWYTSKVYWLLSVFVTVICLLVFLAVIWYGIKFLSDYKSFRQKDDRFTSQTKKTEIKSLDDAYLTSVYPKESYKEVKGKEEDCSYRIFIKLNEASQQTNLMVMTLPFVSDRIELSNLARKILLIHDVPAGQGKNLIIVCPEKTTGESEAVYQLNGLKSCSDQLYFVSYDAKREMVGYGEDKNLFASSEIIYMHSVISRIFHLDTKK